MMNITRGELGTLLGNSYYIVTSTQDDSSMNAGRMRKCRFRPNMA